MGNFWDYSVWGFINILAVLLLSLLFANLLKKSIKFLKNSLIPTSVLGGIILLIIAYIYKSITKENIFNTNFFGGNGQNTLEIITYHCLALGFIATTFKTSKNVLNKQRSVEIFNTGVTTVSTYLLQGVLGIGITIIAALLMNNFFQAAGVLLPFGYGQGTGQAMNYGNIYEQDYGFTGGKSFGLTVAAMGFLSASIGGVIHLNILKRKGKIKLVDQDNVEDINGEQIQNSDEIPMNGSIDKITIQIAVILCTYALAYLLMFGLGELASGLKSILYGFNFLLGVLSATIIKAIYKKLKKMNVVKKEYINPFLMNRICGFCFDLMIVAGIAAIELDLINDYWLVLLILGVVGAFSTYFYNHFIAKTLFPDYCEEQFLAMYGMLTGTASTGIILLREIDTNLTGPVSDNLVYQNFPAIVFGFPMMLIATYAPKQPLYTLYILIGFFIVMNIILFRSKIFKRKKA